MSEKIKIKLKDLKPNPFRNFERNPLDPDRVKKHELSIENRGGLWVPFMVCKMGNELQLVFGHHRLEALKNLYGKDYEIEVEVKNFSSEQMLQVLATENDTSWNHSHQDIDEMVLGAKRLLEKMKEETPKEFRDFAKSLFSEASENKEKQRVSIGAPLISIYLDWPRTRVEESFTRLNAIEEGIVDAHALYAFPTVTSAMTFLRLMKLEKIHTKEQDRLAHEIIIDKRFPEKSMERAIYYFKKYRDAQAGRYADRGNYGDVEHCEVMLKRVVKALKNAVYYMKQFGQGVNPFTMMSMLGEPSSSIDDIRPKTIEEYHDAVMQFFAMKKTVDGWFQELQENKESEEVTDEIEPSPKELAKIAMEKDNRKEEERKEEDSGKPVEEMDIAARIKAKVDKLKKVTPEKDKPK